MADDARWDAGWEGARRFRLARSLEATPAERLAWLEQAIELAHHTGALPRPDPVAPTAG
jgi:hypothetical protein